MKWYSTTEWHAKLERGPAVPGRRLSPSVGTAIRVGGIDHRHAPRDVCQPLGIAQWSAARTMLVDVDEDAGERQPAVRARVAGELLLRDPAIAGEAELHDACRSPARDEKAVAATDAHQHTPLWRMFGDGVPRMLAVCPDSQSLSVA